MGAAAYKDTSMEEILASIRRIVAQDDAMAAVSQRDPRTATPQRTPAPTREAEGAGRLARPSNLDRPAPAARPAPVGNHHAPHIAPAPRVERPVHQFSSPATIREVSQPRSEPGFAARIRAARGVAPEPVAVEAREHRAAPAAIPAVPNDNAPRNIRETLVSPATEASIDRTLAQVNERKPSAMEAHVEAMLRPMLREWLDDNLPGLVERLVRAEVERLLRNR